LEPARRKANGWEVPVRPFNPFHGRAGSFS